MGRSAWFIWPVLASTRRAPAYALRCVNPTAQLYGPAGPKAKARVFAGYCGLVSALVAVWVACGIGFGFSLA